MPNHRIWAAWLLALLVIPAVMLALGVRPYVVTQPPVAAPQWDAGRLLDETYYREIDAWIDDRSAVKGLGLRTRYDIDYALFGDSTSDRVAAGRDGWLFSRSWVDLSCALLDSTDRPAIEPAVADSFTWTVAFGKAYWLSELLEPHDRGDACVISAQDDLRDRLDEDPAGLDINLAIDEDPQGRFYRQDPHWSGAGRLAVAEAVIEHFQPGLWDPDAVVVTEETPVLGMDRFLGTDVRRTVADFAVDRGANPELVSPPTRALGQLVWQHSRVSDIEVIPGTTYIFGDSQMASVVPYIDQYFEELIYVGWFRVALGPLPLDELPSPDRMLVEAIDQWASESFKNPNMLAVADLLGTGDPPS